MDKVIVRVPGGGSFEITESPADPKLIYKLIYDHLNREYGNVRHIKRGPRKKSQKALSGDSEVEGGD